MMNKKGYRAGVCFLKPDKYLSLCVTIKGFLKWSAVLSMSITLSVLASPQYVSSVIDHPKDFAEYDFFNSGRLPITVADVNGDGKKDILWMGWGETSGREILVFEQRDDGQFLNEPDQRIAVKKEIVAYAVADVRSTPGDELVFLTGSAVYSYSTKIQSYSGNITKLFDWPLIKSTPNEKRIYGLGSLKDLNGDDRPDFLLPADGHYGVFLATEDEGYNFIGKVPKAYIDNSKTDNQYFSAFQFLVSERPYQDVSSMSRKEKLVVAQYQGGILNKGNWISSVLSADMDGDDFVDFIYLDDPVSISTESNGKSNSKESEKKYNKKRFNIAKQPSSGALTTRPNKEIPISIRRNIETMRVVDLNNDQLDDIYFKTNNTLSFFLNQGGDFNFENADQVIKVSAVGMEEKFTDLNGDGFPEMCITIFNIGGFGVLATADVRDIAIDRNTLIYKNRFSEMVAKDENSRKIYSRSADSIMENRILADSIVESRSIESVVSSFNPPSYTQDINGDGIRDIAFVDPDGSLSLHAINEAMSIERDSLWQFVPQDAIFGVNDHELNVDGMSDFILEHDGSITVLVSK